MHKVFLAVGCRVLSYLPTATARRLLHNPPYATAVPRGAPPPRQLLVDVSVIVVNDAGTGIQRVVRALLHELLIHPPPGFQVRPVCASSKDDYRYIKASTGTYDVLNGAWDRGEPVSAGLGDVFLGLDLCAHLLPRKRHQLLQWKLAQVQINIVIYDLLPVSNPYWFNPRTGRNFARWLKTIALYADGFVCISHTVRTDLRAWLLRYGGLAQTEIPATVFQLGANATASLPSAGLPSDTRFLLANMQRNPLALMVGTIEPRKGHLEILLAFERLWELGTEVHLVIVGKNGWKTEALQARLRSHPEQGRRLFWLNDVSDELLEALYRGCIGLIAASFNEGFGLPLIEAAHYMKPVLARDIPIFREIAGPTVQFFSTDAPKPLSNTIAQWLEFCSAGRYEVVPQDAKTWHSSAKQLIECLGLQNCSATLQPCPAGPISRHEQI